MAPPFPSATATWHDTSYPAISATRPELSAKGKTVLVTGAGTGIGAEIARSFAAAGASRIALLGRREQPLLDTKASIEQKFPDVKVFAASTDVTKESDVDGAFAKFLGDDKLDVVVSNAAIMGPPEDLETVDNEAFVDSIQLSLRGALYVSQAFLRHAASDATAINISSSAAHMNFAPRFPAYTVAKFAIIRLWDYISFTRPGLRIFSIQPGVVDTDMNRAAGGVKAIGYEDHVSLPADFSVWLASPEADFLKGKFLWTNWDVDELKARGKELESSTLLNVGLIGWPFGEAGYQVKTTGWD